jgi:AcrR family transcriptional regulator
LNYGCVVTMSKAKPTSERVLDSACAVFAAKGFRDATIAEICEKANANIAAVNYHFGDKALLYDACWQHAFKIAMTTFPLHGNLEENAMPEARLRAFVHALVRRIFSDNEASYLPKLMVKEMAEPTMAFERILDEVVIPQMVVLESIISALLGERASEERVRGCTVSVISQCVFFAFNRAMRERHFQDPSGNPQDVERLVDHIWQFSLAGIRDTIHEM